MNIDWFTLSAQVVNFLILLALLKHFLFGPLSDVMKKREQTVTSRLEEAHQKLIEAENKDELYRQKLTELEGRKEEIMSEMRKDAEQYKNELLQQAREEVQQIRTKWEESIEHEKQTFYGELHRQTSANIVELLNRIIMDLSNSTLEEQALTKLLTKLEQMDDKEKKRAIQAALDYGDGQLTVTSSFPLSESQKKKMRNKLREIFSMEISCRFEVSALLGFGIEMRTDSWKVGWNAQLYLDELKKKVDTLFDPNLEFTERRNVNYRG